MEAIILAGGKAERLGAAAGGGPKALVSIAGRPLISYQLQLLRGASVERAIISCAVGQADAFSSALATEDMVVEIAAEAAPLGRGGGIRFASGFRAESGPIFALNGDELLNVDLKAMLSRHEDSGAAATIVVAQVKSSFGIVKVDEDDVVRGFDEARLLEDWVNAGMYVLTDEALARFPEKGDHETSAFPELAAEGRLGAFRHKGVWLTVNTPKELRRADEYVTQNPGWLTAE